MKAGESQIPGAVCAPLSKRNHMIDCEADILPLFRRVTVLAYKVRPFTYQLPHTFTDFAMRGHSLGNDLGLTEQLVTHDAVQKT